MARDGSGIYSAPAGTTATAGTTIESAKYNAFVNDLVTDANTARPIVAGGTGATTAGAALAALGGQPLDAGLTSIAGLTTAADRMIYTTAADVYAVATLTAAGRALLDDADAAAQRTTLGAQASDATLTSLSGLSLVAGDVLYATAADTLQRLAKGTAGQVLAMNSGATAPEWASGTRVLLASKDASASATLDFTEFNNAIYRFYEFDLERVKPATDGVDLAVRFSTNAGVGYDAGASDYVWQMVRTVGGGSTGGGTVGTFLALTFSNNVGNAAAEDGVSGSVRLYNAGTAGAYTRLMVQTSYDDTGTGLVSISGSGRRTLTQDTDALRFLFTTGNIASGTIRMYGVT